MWRRRIRVACGGEAMHVVPDDLRTGEARSLACQPNEIAEVKVLVFRSGSALGVVLFKPAKLLRVDRSYENVEFNSRQLPPCG